ncbi:MAG: hypothetical protein AB1297_08360 [bacterium]
MTIPFFGEKRNVVKKIKNMLDILNGKFTMYLGCPSISEKCLDKCAHHTV